VYGCSVILRRFEGPAARELYFSCQPNDGALDPASQAQAIYRALLHVLERENSGIGAVVSETLFLQSAESHIEAVRAAREHVLASHSGASSAPAITEIQQPPLHQGSCLAIAIQAVIPHASALHAEPIQVAPSCGCAECARAHGLWIHLGGEDRVYAGGLCGAGETAYEQTLGMFGLAEALLQQAGMEFSDVVRAWIHLREMDRDYGDLNLARREFFKARGIDPVPASTGIGGGPVSSAHDLCLGIYAVKAGHPPLRTVMTSPTLNEAGEYGADFVRGMKMVEANKVALHVSGTASIDEAGRTAHVGDFDAQADRMLVNVAALLDGQGATYGDIVSAVTYVKEPVNAERLRQKFSQAGFDGFPNVMVEARVCRPDLLCETEVLAALPVAD
jgi:enamine deaminase RidA (YjgF/YER057c/UK114 family)